MQSVSAGWKENQQKTLVSESFVEIRLGLTDPEAEESVVPIATDVAPFAHPDQIVSREVRNITPYATLERNLWVLDGSKKILPTTNFVDTSYVGNVLSNNDCTFTSNPVVELTFPRVFKSYLPGLIIIWDMAHGDYAVDFKITLYKEGVKGSEKLVTGNDTIRTVVDMDINEYDKIVVEILKWSSPRRRARIAKIHLGQSITYEKGDLFGTFTHSQEADPLSAKLPKMSLKFGVNNVDDSYNPYNQTGISKYLMERQEIQVRYGYRTRRGIEWIMLKDLTWGDIEGKSWGELEGEEGEGIEWIPGGTFYLSGWDAPQNGLYANFEARDILEFMNGIFMKGVYRPNGISLKALAEEVLLDAGLPEREDGLPPWKLHSSLDLITTTAPLPLVRHSECLQMIANAAECVMYVDREGFLRIEPIVEDYFRISGMFRAGQSFALPRSPGRNWKWTDYKVDNFNSYKRPEVVLTKPLKQVDVSYYSFVVDAEVKEIYKGQLSVSGTETIQITYSNPAVETVATVKGGTLVSATYYTNACELKITASGIVGITIVGKELKTSEAIVTVSTGEPAGETQSVKNKLITSQSRAIIVGNWVKEYLTNRKIVSLDWRADPRLDVLDKILVQNKFGISPLRVTEFTITYNGAFKGKGRGRDLG